MNSMKAMELGMEQSNIQQKSENMNNNESDSTELVGLTRVEGTPFTIVRHEEEYYIMMGKYRLTETIGSMEEAKEEAESITWNKILQVVGVMIEELNKDK